MTFLNLGLFAAGAAAVSIPIIIHFLFRRRRKPVVWAAMRFLIEAYKKHQRRLKLEQWLLLATRCLLLLLIALAIGRPVAESAAQALGLGGGRTIYFVVDNSLAASARDIAGDGRSSLDRQKEKASQLIDALGSGDRAALISLGAPAQPIVVPPSADLAAVRGLIESLENTDARADLAGAFSAISRELREDPDRSGQAVVVALSDFRLGAADVSRPLDAVFAEIPRLKLSASRPADAPLGNVQVISAEPLRRIVLARDATGGAAVDVRVRLRRTGAAVGESGVSTVRLTIERAGGEPATFASTQVRWSAGQSEADVVLSAPVANLSENGVAAIVASIDRDAIEGDNRFARPVQVRSAVRVGVAARRRFGALPAPDALLPEDWLRLALAPSDTDPIEVIDVDPNAIDTPTLAALDAIFLPRPDLIDEPAWRRIGAFARSGGLVFVSPPTETTVHLWSDPMARALGLPWRIVREAQSLGEGEPLSDEQPRSPIFEMVQSELPELARSVTVFQTLPIIEGADAPGMRPLLVLEDESTWLIAAPPGRDESETTEEGQDNTESARGLVLYLASAPALTWTDLPARPFIVPLLQELVRQGVGEAAGGSVFTAGERLQPPARTAELVPLKDEQDRSRLSVAPSGLTVEPVRNAGLWQAIDRQSAARGLVAVNADISAGRTEVQPASAVREWLLGSGVAGDDFAWISEADSDSSGATIAQTADNSAWLSYPLLIAAALIALLELALARLFSHASIKPAASATGGSA